MTKNISYSLGQKTQSYPHFMLGVAEAISLLNDKPSDITEHMKKKENLIERLKKLPENWSVVKHYPYITSSYLQDITEVEIKRGYSTSIRTYIAKNLKKRILNSNFPNYCLEPLQDLFPNLGK